LTTAAVAAAIGLAVAGEPSFGTFTDTRDGKTYKTVKIGKQTWMAQNLNYKTKSGSWCYENSADSCDKYGRLYDWKTAQTVCPKRWKLPDTADWNKLVATAGGKMIAGKKLKAKSGWYKDKNIDFNGTDDYGFSALPGGNLGDGISQNNFFNVLEGGIWWTATEYGNYEAPSRSMSGYDSGNDDRVWYDWKDYYRNKNQGYSVRCVADRP
jgi:uncharacterized protein (TIGR02145 family)